MRRLLSSATSLSDLSLLRLRLIPWATSCMEPRLAEVLNVAYRDTTIDTTARTMETMAEANETLSIAASLTLSLLQTDYDAEEYRKEHSNYVNEMPPVDHPSFFVVCYHQMCRVCVGVGRCGRGRLGRVAGEIGTEEECAGEDVEHCDAAVCGFGWVSGGSGALAQYGKYGGEAVAFVCRRVCAVAVCGRSVR